MFPGKLTASRARKASKRREGRTETGHPYLSSNLSIVIFQSLIQLPRCFAVRKTIMGDFIQPALLEIIADFAAINAVFRGIHAENLAKELECSLAIALEIRQDLPDIEVPFGAESARIEQNVTRNGHAHDGAADVDVGKIKGLSIERNKTMGPNLPDIGPEIRQQLALVSLAVCPRAFQLEPINTNANDAAGTWIQPEALQNLLPVVFSGDFEQNLARARGNQVRILPDRFDIDDKCCGLPHAASIRTWRTGQ